MFYFLEVESKIHSTFRFLQVFEYGTAPIVVITATRAKISPTGSVMENLKREGCENFSPMFCRHNGIGKKP